MAEGLGVRLKTRVGASWLATSVAVLTVVAPASAAPKRITGKLSKPGYTVIALALDGRAAAVRASRGRFTLRPPAGRVTLHLRAPNGKYAGPIVVGRASRGRRAIVGVRSGAQLGRIGVRRGYARVSRRVRRKWIDPTRSARARRGVPIGAGKFGRVRSRPPRERIPGDVDFDGVPDSIDIDDDGDLVLDDVDRSTAARAAQALPPFHVFSDLTLFLEQTVNANPRNSLGAPVFSDASIDAALPSFGMLGIDVLAGDSAELDCGTDDSATPTREGLVYCSSGNPPTTGTVIESFCCPAVIKSFPDELDADGDGFGTLTPGPPPPAGLPPGSRGGVRLRHGATSTQIGTGDTLIQWVATGVPEGQCPPQSASCAPYLATQRYIFATVPALVSFSDGQQPPVTVSYPVASGTPESPGDPGALDNPYPVKADPNTGEVKVSLTFWRPQRRRIAEDPQPNTGESGTWTDVGGLAYAVEIPPTGNVCPQTAFSEGDPNLGPPTSAPSVFNGGGGGFIDSRTDQPANPNATLTYTLNLSLCLTANGLSSSFDAPGDTQSFTFEGINPNFGGRASQSVTFQRG
ncbi:MAG: hypothetical protein WD844_14800 [Thermoleophilaceae bacterium]